MADDSEKSLSPPPAETSLSMAESTTTVTQSPPSATISPPHCNEKNKTTASDAPIERILIAGPTLAALLHRFISAEGAIHGLLFGHVSVAAPATLSDDVASTSSSPPPPPKTTPFLLTATITSFISVPSHFPLPISDEPPPSSAVIGWLSGRRRTPLRPTLREGITTQSLFSDDSLHFSAETLTLAPSIFLLLTTPKKDQLIHTHEYKTYQYRTPNGRFEARSLSIINIGPSFRPNYGSFSPKSKFPRVPCDFRGPTMSEDEEKEETLKNTLGNLKIAQKDLNLLAEGFELRRLNQLVGPRSTEYNSEVDVLYHEMLDKLCSLAKEVESSSAKVREHEKRNRKLRLQVAGLE